MSHAEIVAAVKAATGMTVQTGPFAGLRLHDRQTWGSGTDIGSQLLGVYEQELHETIQRFVAQQPTTIVNVGCAEGYYAVGLARLVPGARVYAFDTNPEALEVCRANAELNGVAHRLVTESGCDGARLRALAAQDPDMMLVVDCEGGERELFADPATAAALAQANILIESHDWVDRSIMPRLIGAFGLSHRASVIRPGGRNPHAFPFLDGFVEADKWLLVCETRPELMWWLACDRRSVPAIAPAPRPTPDASESHPQPVRRDPARGRPSPAASPNAGLRPYEVTENGLLKASWRPLIFTVATGADHYLECVRFMLQSLVEFGRYAGDVAIYSDRSTEDCMAVVPAELQSRTTIHKVAPNGKTARYEVTREQLGTYSPILYVDSDIIIDRDLEPILQGIAAQDGVCVTTEDERYPELCSTTIADVVDERRIGNWFGLALVKADPECADRFLHAANSGIIGARHAGTLLTVLDLVKQMHDFPAHEGIASYFHDQPFLNYALVRTGLGSYEPLRRCCAFLGPSVAFPSERRGFCHFIWASNEDKPLHMQAYLAHLRQS